MTHNRHANSRLISKNGRPVVHGAGQMTKAGREKLPIQHTIPPYNILPVIFIPGIMGSNLQAKGDAAKRVWNLDANKSGLPLIGGQPTSLLNDYGGGLFGKAMIPSKRQTTLNPDMVEVWRPKSFQECKDSLPDKGLDPLVSDVEQMWKAGWHEVGQFSYQSFLVWLERALNQSYDPMEWPEFFPAALGDPHVQAPSAAFKGLYDSDGRTYKPETDMHVLGIDNKGECGSFGLKYGDMRARAMFHMPVYAFGYNW